MVDAFTKSRKTTCLFPSVTVSSACVAGGSSCRVPSYRLIRIFAVAIGCLPVWGASRLYAQRVRRWPSRRLPFVAAGVDSPDLPACIFHAPGDPAVIAPEEGRYRYFLSWPLNTKAFQSNK